MAEAVAEVQRRDELPYVADAFLQSLRGLLATYLDRSPERPWKLAERIECPTLLVYGRRDKLVDPIHAHTKAFPDVRVLVLPHAGHVSQIEQPVLVAEAWRGLLAAGVTR
jgi:pimeloyl-ACP methyl ester carboxylesterase